MTVTALIWDRYPSCLHIKYVNVQGDTKSLHEKGTSICTGQQIRQVLTFGFPFPRSFSVQLHIWYI